MALGKLTVVIGAGILGTFLAKDGQFPDVTKLFSGAFKIVTRHLQQDKDNSRSTSKPQTDSLLAQVNTLREELQILASSRSVTIVTSGGSGSARFGVTTVIVVGALGYVFIWWKGWKLSDLMFVTRRGFSDTCNLIGKQMDLVSSSVSAARRHLSSKIDHVDSNLEECKELAMATKFEVSELHGDLRLVFSDMESVQSAVETLRSKLDRIEGAQDLTSRGVSHLCQFVGNLEQRRNNELIQASKICQFSFDSSKRAIEFPQTAVVARALSLPPLSTESRSSSESPSPSSSASPFTPLGNPRVPRSSTVVSTSGLKDLQSFVNTTKERDSKSDILLTPKVPNGSTAEERDGAAISSNSFGAELCSATSRDRSASGRLLESDSVMAEEADVLVAEEKGLERDGDLSEEIEEGEIKDDDANPDAAAARVGAEQPHPLEHSWTFWFDNPQSKSKHAVWGSSLRRIHTFSTVEDFWGLYNNINHPSKLITGADFHCFKDNIEPKWEDPVCANGGKWTISCARGRSDQMWLYTLLAMIGEQFDYGDEICGAVVNVRGKQEKIALWTKNAANEKAQMSIGKQWKEFLDYNDTINFLVHDDAKKLEKLAKNRYTV
ncbi:hypothetical protein ZIOFF_060069 [Zingiber officinale]|uniref:mRNA cap-binding protein n=1 Tax=Zingiber officinale TaxID=94328 RepID=A0A8J5KKR8_ZINOF|nr:hypothetical protein ZIOFF_060069 [Zingiber officinale]